MWYLASKLGQIGPKWDKSGTSPRFVPFGTSLTQFGCQIWHPPIHSKWIWRVIIITENSNDYILSYSKVKRICLYGDFLTIIYWSTGIRININSAQLKHNEYSIYTDRFMSVLHMSNHDSLLCTCVRDRQTDRQTDRQR